MHTCQESHLINIITAGGSLHDIKHFVSGNSGSVTSHIKDERLVCIDTGAKRRHFGNRELWEREKKRE